MLYFRTITVDSADGQIVEKAIRQFSAKRYTSLDLQSSATYIGSGTIFLGLESEHYISITRLRTPFERILPRLILQFDKSKGFRQYKIRLSLLSNLTFGLLLLAMALNIVYSLTKGRFESKMTEVLIMVAIFPLLILIEYKLTHVRLAKAINNILGGNSK